MSGTQSQAVVISDVVGQRGGAYRATALLSEALCDNGLKTTTFARWAEPDFKVPDGRWRIVRPIIGRGSRWGWPERSLAMQAAAFVKRTKPALTIIVGLTSLCARILTTMKPDTAWVWELTNAEKHNKFVDPLAVQRLGRTRGILSPAGVIDSAIRKNYAYKGRIERLQFWIEQGPESYLPSPESFSCDFLFLSRREDDKGLADLIRATAITAVSTRNFRILVAGSGNAERYIRLTEDLKVDDIVRFVTLDSRSDVISVLSRARYVVLPSHHEGFPISILEGTQYSIPFITTPVGAIPEMLGESQACRLNPPGDVNALAESMKISLSESAQLYEYRRKAAFEKHSQMLTRKTAAEKLLALSRNA